MVVPAAPPLPFGQVVIMLISWISFIIYINLLFIILVKKRKRNPDAIISSPVYIILLYNSIGDICMFFHSEFIMRPRKYRFFSVFNEYTPIWIAYASYFPMCVYRLVMLQGYITLAANRLTAFCTPFLYKKIWQKEYVALYTWCNWLIAIIMTLLIFYCAPTKLEFVILPNGILQILGGDFFLRDAIEVAVVSLVSCILCVTCYVGGAIFVMKNAQGSNCVERKLFFCSLLSSIPLLIESSKAWYLLYGTIYDDSNDVIIFVSEMWFYWTEIMTSMQCWSILLITPSARKLLMEEGIMGLFNRDMRKVSVLPHSQTNTIPHFTAK